MTSWILALMLLTACAHWSREPVRLDRRVPERQQYQIWEGSNKHVLHSVRFKADTISGVPRWQPPMCDSCRVFFTRNEIDSIRTRVESGNRKRGTRIGATVLGIAGLAYGLSFCSRHECGTGDAVAGALVFSGIGAVVGYVIGMAVDR